MSKRSKQSKPFLPFERVFSLLTVGVIVFVGVVMIVPSLVTGSDNVLGISTWLARGGNDDNSGSGSSGSGSSGNSSGSGISGSDRQERDDDRDDGHDRDDDDRDDIDSSSSSGSSGSSGSGSSGSSDTDSSGSGGSSFSNFSDFSSFNSDDDDEDFDDDRDDNSGRDSRDTKTETFTESGTRIRTEDRGDEQRTEIKISETERIRTRTKDGRTRIDITSDGVKTRLERQGDRVVVKAQQEGQDEVELEDDALFKIEERLNASGIRIATGSAESFFIQRGTTTAEANFPLSLDLETNQLSVTTPQGERSVTILPDQAVNNLVVTGVIDRLGPAEVVRQFQQGEASAVSDVISLQSEPDQLVYQIRGLSNQRLLGLLPVTVEKEVTVSAESGELVGQNLSLVNTLLDLVSF